jgi:hypothetical protein
MGGDEYATRAGTWATGGEPPSEQVRQERDPLPPQQERAGEQSDGPYETRVMWPIAH